ncbi:DUF5304 domain-containing protein [Streptomyces sp. NPDC086787]|uniref:DUF5304 domain-containing protein n=1 Tax=Streptomyces sp. NPDC086787 TaxID=3365759 RepID=UPI0038301E9B
MSEERPTPEPSEPDPAEDVRATDADAWSTACAEDLEAERARRRAQHGPPPGSAAEELRKLVDAVADKLSGLQSPLLGAVAGPAAQQAVRQVVQQAKAAVDPVIERNPEFFDHLAAAGGELLAAYRSAVQHQEQRWTSRTTGTPDPQDTPDTTGAADTKAATTDPKDRGDDSGPGERIDLD